MESLNYGKKTFFTAYTKQCKPQHFMRKYQGFGISISELEKMKQETIKYVLIRYHGKKGLQLFLSTTEQWIQSPLEHIDQSNGYNDPQKFVPLKEMWSIPLK
jgi:hypothetical protein